ncbi:MAG: M24 family metallopeptidase, partial [Bacteroidota bacterium]|nr:M24 family metallopeptidase [Bacteroidota bacterium]
MINIKSSIEIEQMRVAALLVGQTLSEVAKMIKPGVTTEALDKCAQEFILSKGALPTFKGYNGFPASLCISINEVVVHGIPSKREIKEGDFIYIDCGCTFNCWLGDSAYNFALKGFKQEELILMK